MAIFVHKAVARKAATARTVAEAAVEQVVAEEVARVRDVAAKADAAAREATVCVDVEAEVTVTFAAQRRCRRAPKHKGKQSIPNSQNHN